MYNQMQDISLIPVWSKQKYIRQLQKCPIDYKMMKLKIQRIYLINSYHELEYVQDVLDTYVWIKLSNEHPNFRSLLAYDRTEKQFSEEFIYLAIRNLMLCRKFKTKSLMVLTQQIMVQGMKYFMKCFDDLEKHHKMINILKHIFDVQKPFYKSNYTTQYSTFVVPPSEDQVQTIDAFVCQLKPGDHVDVLRSDIHSKRVCWLPATVKKLNVINVHVQFAFEKGTFTFDRKLMQVVPYKSHLQDYEWRFNLQLGSKIDFQDFSGNWIIVTVVQRREIDDEENPSSKIIDILAKGDYNDIGWLSLADARIVKFGTFTKDNSNHIEKNIPLKLFDDFNDVLLDPSMTCFAVTRPEISTCLLLSDLITFAHRDLNLFGLISEAVSTRKFNIEVTSELISIVGHVQQLFHRRFAIDFLRDLSESIFAYVTKSNDVMIRNFSKQRYEAVVGSLKQFLKRFMPSKERDIMIQNFEFDLILRFLNSDFLDRKLHSVMSLTKLIKMSKANALQCSKEQFLSWIRNNGIIRLIYNEKSHSQLINRSMEFIQEYVLTYPPLLQLEPLLEWNDAIVKLVKESFDYFSDEFRDKVVERIKARTCVVNKDALQIIKRTPGCEKWLLQNGGECWVDVVKDKHKRKADIAEVFKCPFPVVQKITNQMSTIYDKIKNEYFFYLHTPEVNYLAYVLNDQSISLERRLDFAILTVEPLGQISEGLFTAFLPFTRSLADSVCVEYQLFLANLLYKMSRKNVCQLFEANFRSKTDLQSLGMGQMAIFRNCFMLINKERRNIESELVYEKGGYRVSKMEQLTVRVNPNELLGMKELMLIIFDNRNIAVTQVALELIGFLFDHLDEDLADSLLEFKSRFLESCLQEFYRTTDQHAKYLKIIEKLLDESEKEGCDAAPSVNALFPSQTINLKVIDHFNVNKRKLIMQSQANLALYELRIKIGRHINAYVSEMKILINDKQLDPRLNGRVLHTLGLGSSDLVVEKVTGIERGNLLQNDSLSDKFKEVLKVMFKEYSSHDLMSKAQCQKYQQRCLVDMMQMSESKVDKIFEDYDKDKDGYLTQEDFFKYYLHTAKNKEMHIWTHLENFGMRADLEILYDKEYEHPNGDTLTRHLLLRNNKFMLILLGLLQVDDESLAASAWSIISRLPLAADDQFFTAGLKLDLTRKYMFRYWLYMVGHRGHYELVTESVLRQIMESDIQTTCIGLKIAINSAFDVATFRKAIRNLSKLPSGGLTFYGKVLLDNTLKIMDYFLKEDNRIREDFIEKHEDYEGILIVGLMSKDTEIRKMFSNAIEEIIMTTALQHLDLFEIFFQLVYRNFEKCDKATLSIEYFDLYSNLIEILRDYPQLLASLKLNWLMLTQYTINLFVEHQCTQTSLNSKPDEVAQGYLRIIRKLLDANTIVQLVPLVKYIFQQSLFPEAGKNKLKNAKTRKDAYELIYEICNFRDERHTLDTVNNIQLQTEHLKLLDGHLTVVKGAEQSVNVAENCRKQVETQQVNSNALCSDEAALALCSNNAALGSRGLDELFAAGFKGVYKKMSQTKSPSSYAISYFYYENQARSELGYAGLRNLGCICYMNSMLQQLYMTRPFRSMVLMAEDGVPECLAKKGAKEVDDNLFHQLKIMFANLQLTEKQEFNPDQFCFAFKDFEGMPMNVSIQQDAQEFINLFFDKMESSLKGTCFRGIFETIFGGKTCSQTVCSNCKAVNEREQNFYPLSLQIKGYKNIEESLGKFVHEEIISDYQCDFCNKKTDVKKSSLLSKVPNHLIIHLQRMCFNYDKYENEKVNSRWEFPMNLNVYNYSLEKQKGTGRKEDYDFQLKGIVLHYGSADFGHYFSYIKETDTVWIQFNDERVREFDPRDIELDCFGGEHWRRESQSAYLLVYEKVIKSPIKLEFNSSLERDQYVQNFKLQQWVVSCPQAEETKTGQGEIKHEGSKPEEENGEGNQEIPVEKCSQTDHSATGQKMTFELPNDRKDEKATEQFYHAAQTKQTVSQTAETKATETKATETKATQTNAIQTNAIQTNAIQTNAIQTNAIQTNEIETNATETKATEIAQEQVLSLTENAEAKQTTECTDIDGQCEGANSESSNESQHKKQSDNSESSGTEQAQDDGQQTPPSVAISPAINVAKYPLYLSMSQLPIHVPLQLKTRINKANQQFSFTINLCNDEFAYFLHKILSIDPPPHLTTEYLELCHECFSLKQVVDESEQLTLSEWAILRFKKIIRGHGWEFLKTEFEHWKSDLLSIQKATRVGVKNLLQCVITDIIQSNRLVFEEEETEDAQQRQSDNEDSEQDNDDRSQRTATLPLDESKDTYGADTEKEQTEGQGNAGTQGSAETQAKAETDSLGFKRKTILRFLRRYHQMMGSQVSKNPSRFKEYFEVWIFLVEQNEFVLRFCQHNRLVECILDLLLEDSSPFSKSSKKFTIRTTYYSVEYDQPLELLALLISKGYQLSTLQASCMKNYTFIEKLVKYPIKHLDLILRLCFQNQGFSERFAHTALNELSKVGASEEIKPIISTLEKFLHIRDSLQPKRIEWIIGFPQYVQNPKTGSYGVFDLCSEELMILNYVSGVRAVPVLQQLIRFKNKVQHAAALLLSMLLKLQADGLIHNIDEYPSVYAYHYSYSFWFCKFSEDYYQETHRGFMTKNYLDYGKRLKSLYEQRPYRPLQPQPHYLIGRSSLKEEILSEHVGDVLDISYVQVTSNLLLIDDSNSFLSRKNIKHYPGSESFRGKTTSWNSFHTSHHSALSSDEDQPLLSTPCSNPFDRKFLGKLFVRVLIKNKTRDNLLVVLTPPDTPDVNVFLSKSEVSFEIKGDSFFPLTLQKKDIEKSLGQLTLEFRVIGKATRAGLYPKQIITPIAEDRKQEEDNEETEIPEFRSKQWDY